jgi:predicted Zn-dependent protease
MMSTKRIHFGRIILRHGVCLALLTLMLGCGISRQQEIEMGLQARPQFEQEFGGLYEDPEVQQYVQEVGMALVDETDRRRLPWEFRVLDSDSINAFALPGGFIYITRGLLFNLRSEAELAAILGHEVAHVAHRHSVQQLQRAQLVQGGAALAGLFGGGEPVVADVAQLVAGLALMTYSREQEKEADLSGLKYLAAQGYEPRAMLNVMRTLGEIGGKARPPEFLSSHPNPETREEYLARRVRRDYRDVITAARDDRREFEQRVLQSRQSGAR